MPTAPTLAALAVVIRDDHVLLVQRRNEPDAGLWGFPGGHVDLGETALDAAVRELAEETGVRARALRYLTNIDVIVHGPDGTLRHHFLLAVVLCAYPEGDPVAADDALAAEWVPVMDVMRNRLACSRHVDDVVAAAVEALARA
ncbi:NUDIX hydrolase [Pseudosulfitobacter koreensis]|uniref:NUDIX hydrolase n=1 Tax=Pseudosulfitobacter koreensis TaxID=2968472 RepID=A0ABT1Z0H9_9RHOB|nr:NUDIX hydrolase [Pseudosulfitobacter koreense]MCR8826633.1 NUDIX hydrolase [Pseudosulfitobacter koreense]